MLLFLYVLGTLEALNTPSLIIPVTTTTLSSIHATSTASSIVNVTTSTAVNTTAGTIVNSTVSQQLATLGTTVHLTSSISSVSSTTNVKSVTQPQKGMHVCYYINRYFAYNFLLLTINNKCDLAILINSILVHD